MTTLRGTIVRGDSTCDKIPNHKLQTTNKLQIRDLKAQTKYILEFVVCYLFGIWILCTVIYAFMQAAGLVNDHIVSCFRYEQCKNSEYL